MTQFHQLITRDPQTSTAQMIADLVPPREFAEATLENYRPDDRFPSQKDAQNFCLNLPVKAGSKSNASIYLDGGFGVGKTHLMVGLYKRFKGSKAFGSFLAFTSLIGALGFAAALQELAKFDLICIDEFELDDPGNTMIMSRLLNELSAKGVRFAATSNTPPNALGEGRFAAADFRREILGIGEKFTFMRIDGEDFRHRPTQAHSSALSMDALGEWLLQDQAQASIDDFPRLLAKLSDLHPAKYSHLLDGIERIGLTNVQEISHEFDALRFVAFVDRAYEAGVQMKSTGIGLTNVFAKSYFSGSYQKKYQRAVSRLGSMSL